MNEALCVFVPSCYYRKQFAYSYAAFRSISIARAEYISSYNIFGKACFSKGRSPADNKVIRGKCFNGFCARLAESAAYRSISLALRKAKAVTSATRGDTPRLFHY